MRASNLKISDSLHVLNFGSRRTVHCDAKRGIAKQKLNTKHVHDQIVLSDDYLDFDREPISRLIGPVKVQLIPGKGRGVLATRDVVCGEPLLLSQPVIFMKDELGVPPRLETAIKDMRSEDLSAGKKYRLSFLNTGTPERSRLLPSLEMMVDAEAVMKKQQEKEAAAKKGFGAMTVLPSNPAASNGRKNDKPPHGNSHMSSIDLSGSDAVSEHGADELDTILRLNSVSGLHTDLVASHCRGQKVTSFLGLWPEVAMINHSCAPNALRVLLGDRMLVRATRNLLKGEEVTLSYLSLPGPGQGLEFSPVNERRRMLQDSHGFECNCYRCKLELSQPPEIQAALQSVHDWLSDADLLTKTRSAVTAKDLVVLEQLKAELLGRVVQLEKEFEAQAVTTEVRLWLKASAYGLYELLANCQDVGNESDPGQLAQLTPLMTLVAPGSEAHLLLTLERLLRAGQIAKTSPETEQAAKECILAHSLRYGKVSDASLTKIMGIMGSLDAYLGRYSLENLVITTL